MGGLTAVLSLRRPAPFGRSQAVLVGLLVALAALAWWDTSRRMGPMTSTPGADLGSLAVATWLWVVMMAAMMLPSVAPTVTIYDGLRAAARRRSSAAPGGLGTGLFVGGYLAVWTATGLLAWAVVEGMRRLDVAVLSWDRAGQELTAGIVLAAAAYQLTPAKRRCLVRCRSPLMFLLEHWREGHRGALRMGAVHGAWCVGCCWALMATLFAVGVMSLGWMALVAALIAAEKLLPRRARGGIVVAAILIGLGVAILVAPDAVPGLGPDAAMRM